MQGEKGEKDKGVRVRELRRGKMNKNVSFLRESGVSEVEECE